MRAFVAGSHLARFWQAALGLVYPEICQLCQKSRATPLEGYVCSGCRNDVRFVRPPFCARCGIPFQGDISSDFECSNCRGLDFHFSFARSAVVATGNALEIIHRYKYNRALWFEPLLVSWLVGELAGELAASGPWDLIVPVPLHPTKLREREFNQAERLARGLAKASGIPINNRIVRRTIPTRTQTLLSREERQANIRNAFAVPEKWALHGERLVLVDDVFTTGATTNECARALKRAGAGEVCVWTLARGI